MCIGLSVVEPASEGRDEPGLPAREERLGQLGSGRPDDTGLAAPSRRIVHAGSRILQARVHERDPQLERVGHGGPVGITKELVPHVQPGLERLDRVPAVTRSHRAKGGFRQPNWVARMQPRFCPVSPEYSGQLFGEVDGSSQEIRALQTGAVADEPSQLRPVGTRQIRKRFPRGHDTRDSTGRPYPLHQAGDLTEGRIAAQKLVTAEAAESDLDAGLVGSPADPVGVQPVDARLVHRRERVGQSGQELVSRYPAFDVPGSERSGHFCRQGTLVRFGAPELAKAEGHRRRWLRQVSPREGRDEARIEPRREEDRHRNVRHEVSHDTFLDGIDQACLGRTAFQTLGQRLRLSNPRPAHRHHMACRHGLHRLVDGPRLGDRAPQQEPTQSCRIGMRWHGAARDEGLNLGSESQVVSVRAVVERLDAVWIPPQQQPLLVSRPREPMRTSHAAARGPRPPHARRGQGPLRCHSHSGRRSPVSALLATHDSCRSRR